MDESFKTKEIDQLKSSLAEKTKIIDALRAELKQAASRASDESQLKTLRQECEALKTEKADLVSHLDRETRSAEQLTSDIGLLQRSFDELKNDSAATIARLEADLAASTNQRQSTDLLVQELTQRVSGLQNAPAEQQGDPLLITELENQIAQLQLELSATKSAEKLPVTTSPCTDCVNHEISVKELTSRVESLLDDLQLAEAKAADASESASLHALELESTKSELTEAESRFILLESDLKVQIVKLESELAVANNHNEVLSAENLRLKQTQADLVAASNTSDGSAQQAALLLTRVQQLESDKLLLQDHIRDHLAKQAKTDEISAKLGSDYATLQAEFSILMSQHAAVSERLVAAELQRDEFLASNDLQQASAEASAREVESLNEFVSTLKSDMSRIAIELEADKQHFEEESSLQANEIAALKLHIAEVRESAF